MNDALLSSKNHDWRTPIRLFNALDAQYNFGLDAAASKENALCTCYYTEENNALELDWAGFGNVFCNPPYGRQLSKFVEKAYQQWEKHNVTSVLLIPARTDTRIWQEIVLKHCEVTYLKGRLKFLLPDGRETDPAPFPSAIVVFHGWKSILFS